ncbi:H-NS family nucleoid-associated regulatory protein [Roseateles chitinivorans]|uniref:H-NS histone family protein n=1 Tax=Roseateles chitinivorans TaxID=2917965 RepID=UPI003D664A87
MSNVDLSKLSYAELVELSKELERQIAGKRDEELKVLVDGFAKKVQAAGFTVDEALDALQPYASPPKRKGASAGGAAPALYRDPANAANTWSGRGRVARWLADYESQGRRRQEFKI